jgi:hypothetical protein
MVKVVYAEGCSITAGAEHADWQMTNQGLEYSQTTWAGQIAKMCFPKAKYFPTARSGASQSHIRRRSLFYLNQLLKEYKPNEILFLAQWTCPNRTEVRVKEHTPTKNFSLLIDEDESHYIYSLPIDLPKTENLGNRLVDQKDRNKWLAVNRVQTLFYQWNMHIISPETNAYNNLTEIESIRNFCKLHGIQMYETIGFGDLIGYYNPVTNCKDKFVNDLIERVDLKNTAFYCNDYKSEGLLEYSKRTGAKVGPGGHPLEEAHSHWARMMINYFGLDILD